MVLFVASLVCLAMTIAGVIILRQKRQGTQVEKTSNVSAVQTVSATAQAVAPRSKTVARPPRAVAAGLSSSLESLQCPTCLREFHGNRYCTSDARKLAPSHEVKERGRGVVCQACKRAFDPGLATCPHDNSPLYPATMHHKPGYRQRPPTAPALVIASICPLCGTRDDLHARFCGKDGAALLVIN